MTDGLRDPTPGGAQRTGYDLILRYRELFGDAGADGDAGAEGNAAYAGPLWHIIVVSHLILSDLESLLAGTDLSPADMFVLGVLLLDQDRALRPSDVARILSVTPAAISLRVAKLERLGLLRRSGGKPDRRIVLLQLTAQGIETIRVFLDRVGREGRFALALAKLDGGEASELERMLGVISREMDRYTIR